MHYLTNNNNTANHTNMIFPMTYSLLNAYVSPIYPTYNTRDIDIVCTLRGGQHWDPTRSRVRWWVGEYGKERNISNIIAGNVNTASRYVHYMYTLDICIYYGK